MNKQRGVSLIGLLIVSGVLVFFAIIGFKLLPSYIEYFTIKRIVSDIAHSPEIRGGTIRQITITYAPHTGKFRVFEHGLVNDVTEAVALEIRSHVIEVAFTAVEKE